MTIRKAPRHSRDGVFAHKVATGLYLRSHTRNLSQEGAASLLDGLKRAGVRVVVCVAPRADDRFRAAAEALGISYVHAPFADGTSVPESLLLPLAERISKGISRGEGAVLHCNAGRNRSALLAALVLVKQGVPSAEALDRVRSARPGALANEAFARYLEDGAVW
jgi:protein-tyrosine phosphatase